MKIESTFSMKNSKVSQRKTEKGEKTKKRVLEEAINLFYEYGFVKVSTRELVQRVGMSSSSIYNHFPNKDYILFTIIHQAGDKALNLLNETMKEYDDPEECLKHMISKMIQLFETDMRKEIVIFIDELTQLPEELREKCNKQHRQIFELFESKVRELQRKDLTNQINYKVATFGIVGAMLWVYHWFRNNGALSINEISDEILKLLFKGLIRSDVSTLST